MKLIIDVDEKLVCEGFERHFTEEEKDILIRAIGHGTPLPKGHGRLIDADAYIDKQEECGWLDDIPVSEFNRIALTIIEADEENRE